MLFEIKLPAPKKSEAATNTFYPSRCSPSPRASPDLTQGTLKDARRKGWPSLPQLRLDFASQSPRYAQGALSDRSQHKAVYFPRTRFQEIKGYRKAMQDLIHPDPGDYSTSTRPRSKPASSFPLSPRFLPPSGTPRLHTF